MHKVIECRLFEKESTKEMEETETLWKVRRIEEDTAGSIARISVVMLARGEGRAGGKGFGLNLSINRCALLQHLPAGLMRSTTENWGQTERRIRGRH